MNESNFEKNYIRYEGEEYSYFYNEGVYILESENDNFELDEHQFIRMKEIVEKNVDSEKVDNELVSYYNDNIQFNPFQYKPYFRLISKENHNQAVYITDEVGVGKTYETGIIISELLYSKSVALDDNILIICPNMLCKKWQEVLHYSFGLYARIIRSCEEIHGISIISYDSISRDTLIKEKEIKLLIIDEAHNAGGARFEKIFLYRKMVQKNKGYTVLLSATPLNGKNNSFEIQEKLLLGDTSLKNYNNLFEEENVYVNKTLKDVMRTQTVDCLIKNVMLYEENDDNNLLLIYIKISDILFKGRNTINKYAGLNMIGSSPQCAKSYCEMLLNMDIQKLKDYILGSNINKEIFEDFGYETIEDVYEEFQHDDDIAIVQEMNIQEELEYLKKECNNLNNKIDEVLRNPIIEDEKLKALLKLLDEYKEKANSEQEYSKFYKKIVVFTNYNDTAKYLSDNISESVVINGLITTDEKWNRFNKFKNSDSINVLIITNVACEGQDMDFCNTIVNYDLTYNPVQLVQRKGRIDRFEVKKPQVFIYNFKWNRIDPKDEEYEILNAFDYNFKNESLSNMSQKYSNSMYPIILRYLNRINKETGIYYRIIDEIGVSNKSINKEQALEQLKKLFEEYFNRSFADIEDINAYYEEHKNMCYQKVNQELGNAGIKIKRDNRGDEYIAITIKKDNQDILRHIYDGGTLNSHLIYNKVGR